MTVDVEELACALEALCTPEDRFDSHADAVALAGELIEMAQHGDPMAAHTISVTLTHVRGER